MSLSYSRQVECNSGADMRPFELFYIGERVVITGPVKSFPARRFNGPEQSYGITGVIASSGGPSGHSVQLDTGRLVGAPIGSIRRS